MRYDMVFEGGGARGIVFVGALHELEARGHTPGRLLGTSAGAVVAVLLAAGYAAAELERALGEKVDGKSVFARFLGQPPAFSREEIEASAVRAFFRDLDMPLLPGMLEGRLDEALAAALMRFPAHRNFYALVERGGWYAADQFVQWMRTRLNSGLFAGQPRRFADMTLGQFHAATGVFVSVVAADTSEQRLRVLNHRTAPDCPVVMAVRMSMNLPFVWPDVVWKAAWGKYLGKPLAGNVMVDGGLLSSFPIELLVSNEPFVTGLMGPQTGARVLGMLIDETLPVPEQPAAAHLPGGFSLPAIKAVTRISRMVATMTGARDRMVMEAFADLFVRLPAQGYGTLEFEMSDARRDGLLAAGREAMRAWFERPQLSDSTVQPGTLFRTDYADRAARALLQP